MGEVPKNEMDASERLIFDPFAPHTGPWNGLIILRGGSFKSFKWIAGDVLKRIAEAKDFRGLPICGGGTSGSQESEFSFNTLFVSPVENQVNELRRRANELEQTLGDKTAPTRRQWW